MNNRFSNITFLLLSLQAPCISLGFASLGLSKHCLGKWSENEHNGDTVTSQSLSMIPRKKNTLFEAVL